MLSAGQDTLRRKANIEVLRFMIDPRFDHTLATDADIRTVTDRFMLSTPQIQRRILFKLSMDKMALSEMLAKALALSQLTDSKLRSDIKACLKHHG